MGFIFGLMVGSMFSGGGGTALPPSLAGIPFRCFAAFEISETDYEVCRRGSLRSEVYKGFACELRELDKPDGPCSYAKAIHWEIAGLRELKKAIDARSSK